MEEFMIESMNKYGYLGILALIALENIFPPIPSEIILTFGGFMTTYTKMTTFGVLIFSTIGSVLGSIILYWVGTLFTESRLDKILENKYVRLLGFKKAHISKAIDLFASKGKLTVLFARCIPIVRSLISIPAGISKMHFGTFLFYTTIGTVTWNLILINLGAFAGSSWKDSLYLFDKYSTLILVSALIISSIVISVLYYKNKKSKSDN